MTSTMGRSDWERSVATSFVDRASGVLPLTPEGTERLLARFKLCGAVDRSAATRALSEELTKLLHLPWKDVLTSVWTSSRALHDAAHPPTDASKAVDLLGTHLPVTAPFEIEATIAARPLVAVRGEMTLTVSFNVSVNVRGGGLVQVNPFSWKAGLAFAVDGFELWSAEARDHTLTEPYPFATPWPIP